MFYEKELRYLQKMLDKCRLSNMVIDPEAPIVQWADSSLQPLLRSLRFADTFYDMVPDFQPATVYRLLDVFLCRYIFLDLPYCSRPSVLLIGPYLHHNITQQQILEQAERLGIPPSGARELEALYSYVPIVRDEYHLFAMVTTFAECIFGEEDKFSCVDLYFNHSAASLPDLIHNTSSEADGLDAAMMESRYKFENELIEAVSQGNIHKAELMTVGLSNHTFENRASDQLRNLKNYCIIMNTLMRKAAEKGRVHPIHLDRISSDFAHRIETIRSLNSISDFMQEMLRSYCRLVKQHSMQNYSPLIQKTMIFVEGNLTGDLSLGAVATKK